MEPAVPSSVRPRPSSGLRRDTGLPLRLSGALPPPLCHGGAECTEIRQWGCQLPLPCGGVELARAQRVREGDQDPRLTPAGQPDSRR